MLPSDCSNHWHLHECPEPLRRLANVLEPDAQVDIEDLPGRSEGMIALTGGPNGPVGRLIANGQGPAAEEVLMRLASIYENRLYVELMRHNLEVENRIEGDFIDLAYRHNIPLVA